MKDDRGIVVYGGEDTNIAARARSSGIPVAFSDISDLRHEKTLLVQTGTRVPWDLLPCAWNFLQRWDAAVPLYRYGVLAQDIGQEIERKLAKNEIRDLRVLLYSYELLFVRRNDAGQALIETWRKKQAELENLERRLTFLRAVYAVKPRLCVLPVTWLADVQHSSKQAMARGAISNRAASGKRMVTIELEPGRYVKCYAGDEERVRRQYQDMKAKAR